MRLHPEKVQELVDKEIKKGHMLGPFDQPPLPNMVYSLLNLVPKAGLEGEFRLIHDLAYPYNDESINRCVPEDTVFSEVSLH